MIAALFDCDGTLYSAEMGRGLMKYAAGHGRRAMVRLYLASLMPRYLLNKAGLIGREALRVKAVARQRWLLRGWDTEQAAAAFDWLAHHYLLPTQRDDVADRLVQHRERGHAIVLVSGMLRPCLALLGDHYQADGIVGTEFEIVDGHYTGRLLSPVINGPPKATYIHAFFAEQGAKIDWAASYAYADSIHDQAMFNLVGHPVAVHPDPELLVLAQDRGWPILH
jgi:HAD superfamily hydrolase (TIGR01490 family)